MDEKPKLNKRMLNKVLSHIKADSRRFDMSLFAERREVEDGYKEEEIPPCGTVACIGGWAYLLTISPRSWGRALRAIGNGDFDIAERARKILGLTFDEADSLFLTWTGDDSFRTAKAKIDLLKKDREKFVAKYPHLG